MLEASGMSGMLVGKVELAPGIEPVVTIGHHQPGSCLSKQSTSRSLVILSARKECV